MNWNLLRIRLKRMLHKFWKGSEYIALHDTVELARAMGVEAGTGCRFYSTNFSTEPYLISVGNHVTITNVQFITHDGGVWVFRDKDPDLELFGRIKIGNNVFVGLNAIILMNTVIGDNCIVAAGAIVKGNFDASSVIAGIPAKRLCSVEEYFEKNKDSVTRWKSLEAEEKRKKIIEKFIRN